MNDQEFSRLLDAVDGYWPHAPLKPNARKAWRHLLGKFPIGQTLDAIAAYAAEGQPYPPVAGQLAARVSPPKADTTHESEPDRCKRQMAQYLELMNGPNGSNTTRDSFDFYWGSYWSHHLPESAYPFKAIDTPNQANAA